MKGDSLVNFGIFIVGVISMFWGMYVTIQANSAERVRNASEAVKKASDNAALLAELIVKVNTMWDRQEALANKQLIMRKQQMRLAESEAVVVGLASKASPLKFKPEVLSQLDQFKPDLQTFYKSKWYNLDDDELWLEVEDKFGTTLQDEICIPNKLWHGACVLMAMAVAKNTDTLDLKF